MGSFLAGFCARSYLAGGEDVVGEGVVSAPGGAGGCGCFGHCFFSVCVVAAYC